MMSISAAFASSVFVATLTVHAADPLYWTGSEKATSTAESPYDIWNAANWGYSGTTSSYDLYLSVTERTYIQSTNGTTRVGSSLCPYSGEFVFTGPLLNYALKAGNVTNSTVSILKKSGDWTFSTSSGAYFGVATNSTVVFTNESGNVNASAGQGEIGPAVSSYAKVVNLSGNWAFKNNLVLAGGVGSTGIVENVSGDWSVGGDMRVANNGYGEFTQYGGSLTVGGDMYISFWASGNGVLTIKGGTVTIPSGKSVYFRYGTGTINLDGGTLVTKRIHRLTGNGTLIQNINFNGGTLKASAADTNPFIYGPSGYMYVTVNAGGGTIDCNGYPITIDLNTDGINKDTNGILKGEGGLTFTGGNTITINSPVTYAGVTRVTPGTTLAVANEIAKNNILANGLVVAGIPTAGQTVFTYTSALDDADLTKVSCVCAPGTTFKFSDEGKTNIVVDVVGSPDWAKYSHKFKVSFSGYTGSEALANFPVLVKISESRISGFRYADCKRPSGADLRFADADGNLLASEVDTWNTSGESLVWVKVPSLTAATTITAYYGWDFAPVVDPNAVWSNGYVAVWHLNEAAVPLAESSGMSTPFVLPASTQERTTYATNGIAGGKAVSFDNERYNELNPRLEAADDPDLRGLTNFTVECWTYQTRYRGVEGERDATIIGNWLNWKLYQETNGVVVCRWQKFDETGTTSNSVFSAKSPALALNEWTHSTFVRNFTGESSANGTMYLNGGSVATKSESSAKATGKKGSEVKHSLGAGDSIRVFPGSIDEVRVSNVARSADWVKASHDTVTESSFARYGSARENVDKGMIIILR